MHTPITETGGYWARFWDLVRHHQAHRDPMRQAYLDLERELAAQGYRRYTNYHSFRTGKYKRPKKVRLTGATCHP